jgi:methyltransferase (TIGR00027 family)
MAERTAFMDDETLRAINDGVGQIVIVGAGYDGRALRFRSHGVRFFEVDHPATQADKCRRVGKLGMPIDNVTFVPIIDLKSSLPENSGISTGTVQNNIKGTSKN